MEKKGKAFVILCKWILKLRELGFDNVRGNLVAARKGERPAEGDELPSLAKLDSQSLSYYNKHMPSYRWPKRYGKEHQERYEKARDLKALFLA